MIQARVARRITVDAIWGILADAETMTLAVSAWTPADVITIRWRRLTYDVAPTSGTRMDPAHLQYLGLRA